MDAIVLATIQAALPLVVLVSIRIGVAFALLPAPFGSVAPGSARAVLSILIATAISLPQLHLGQTIDLSPFRLLVAALGEAMVGAVIGLTVRTVLAAAEIAGDLGGSAMGLGFAHTVDPLTQEGGVPTSRLLVMLTTSIFLALQGHHLVLRALAASVRQAPPGHALQTVALDGVLRTGSSMLAHGLQIAAPVVGTMFIVHIGKGMITKAASKVQLMALFFAVAIATGLLTLSVAAPSVAAAVAALVHRLPDEMARSIGVR